MIEIPSSIRLLLGFCSIVFGYFIIENEVKHSSSEGILIVLQLIIVFVLLCTKGV